MPTSGNDTLFSGEALLISGDGTLSGAGSDTLYNGEPIFIGGDDTLSSGGNDTIFNPGPPPHGLGTNGNDTLSTIRDFDWLVGLGGDDTYIVSHDYVLMVEEAGGGIDRVYSRVHFVLPAHVEILGLMDDAGNIDGTGNDLPNLIWGSLGNNTMRGAGGDDIVTGGGGVDTSTATPATTCSSARPAPDRVSNSTRCMAASATIPMSSIMLLMASSNPPMKVSMLSSRRFR